MIIAIRVIENDYRTDTLVDHENECIVPSPVFLIFKKLENDYIILLYMKLLM